MNPKYITIHSTGNDRSTAQNEADYVNRNNLSTGYHYVVGDDIIIQVVPDNEVAYHAGDGRDGKGNTQSIGIEMVHTGNREKVIRNTIQLTKLLQDKFNIPISNVVRHHDWSGKNCPIILNYNNWRGWVEFKALLEIEHKGGLSNMTEKEVREIVYDIIEPSRNGGSPNAHWAYKHFTNLNELGANLRERRFDDMMTRGEVFAFIDKLLTSINLTDK